MLTHHRGGPRWGRRWKWTKEVHIYTHIYLHVCEYIHAQTAHTGSLIKQNILFCHLFVMVCVCALMIRLPLHRLTPCFSFYHAYCTCQENGETPYSPAKHFYKSCHAHWYHGTGHHLTMNDDFNIQWDQNCTYGPIDYRLSLKFDLKHCNWK